MLEAKTSRNLTSFPLFYGATPAIAKHQIREGERLTRAGGLSLILIRREEYGNKKTYEIPVGKKVGSLIKTKDADKPGNNADKHRSWVSKLDGVWGFALFG